MSEEQDTAALVETVTQALNRSWHSATCATQVDEEDGGGWCSPGCEVYEAKAAFDTLAQRLADLTEKAVAYAIESNERLARADRAEAVLREIATSEKLKPAYVTDPYVRLAVDNARAAVAATPTEEPEP